MSWKRAVDFYVAGFTSAFAIVMAIEEAWRLVLPLAILTIVCLLPRRARPAVLGSQEERG